MKAIVQNLKKRNPNLPIEDCIDLTLKARKKVSEEHVIITKIRPTTLELLKERSKKDRIPIQTLLKRLLLDIFPIQDFNSLRLVNRTIILATSTEDFKLVKEEAQKNNIELENLLDVLLNRELEN